MTTKKYKIAAAVALMLVLGVAAALGTLLGTVREAKAEPSAQAYILHEDRGTRGFWYTGEKGTKDAAQNRIYGKSGFIWMYHYAWADGQPFKDVSMINDFTEESQVNYVEYPSWVSSVTGDIQSINDTPHGYWNNSQLPVEKVVSEAVRYPMITKRLLPIDPSETNIAHTGIQFTRSDINYTVTVNDDEWHRITVYIGSTYQTENQYLRSILSLYDLDGNLLTYDVIDDVNTSVWVSYAVKGSVRINIDGSAYMSAAFSAIAFDEYEENEQAKVTGFTARRDGVKTIQLSWQGGAGVAKLYRRQKGENIWHILARVDGANTYSDQDTDVATEYEYMIAGGTARTYAAADNYYNWVNCDPDVVDLNIPQESDSVTCATAPYAATRIEFDSPVYTVAYGGTLDVTLTVSRFENGAFVPYEGASLTLELSGDAAYSYVNGVNYPNMETHIGTRETGADGTASFSYDAVAAGEYTLTASVPAKATSPDGEEGYAACAAEATFVHTEQIGQNVPVLLSVSDAIKPGDTVTVTGNFLTPDSDLTVAYAQASDENPDVLGDGAALSGVKYIRYEDILVTDSVYETGLMFVFPKTEKAWVYDIWVKNRNGWSEKITMNAARPLYMNQDGGYEGVKIEVVGRNFFLSDFGMCDEETAREMTKVKLVRTGNVNGEPDGIAEVRELNIVSGVRYAAENSATGLDIDWSNPYKITFETPAVNNYGTYDVYVAADGIHYRPLNAPQKLKIYPKKAQAWDETVFGPIAGNTHVGNDPLDLGMFWAQDLNYTDVITMQPNTAPGSALNSDAGVRTLTGAINTAAQTLAKEHGGGVIYFPEGEYYFGGLNSLPANILLVGAGTDKTRLYYVGKGSDVWIRAQNVSNVGLARVACELYEESTANPEYIALFGEEIQNADENRDIANRVTVNKFITDCSFRFDSEVYKNGKNTRAMLSMSSLRYILMQNCTYDGGNTVLYANYHNEYGIIRNVRARVDSANSASPSLTSDYTFIENVHQTLSYQGHGYCVKNNAYLSNCYITKSGTVGDKLNIGEMVVIEPPGGYLAVGSVLTATPRSFTVDTTSGSRIDWNTRKDYSNFAIFITDGRGAGQLRYFKKTPVSDGYGNSYELMDDEKDFDIVPDSTSKFTILLPLTGATIYRFKGNDNKKAIFLYSNCFDSVVAECDLTDTEGIAVFSTDIANVGRFCPNIGVRIENNTVRGVSPQTGKGGITLRSERSASLASSGMQMLNITIRNNTVTGAKGDYAEYIPGASEAAEERGIAIHTGSTRGQDTSGDVRFIVIEGNTVSDCEYGVYADNRITGLVVRNNAISDIEAGEEVTYFAPNQLYMFAMHTLCEDGSVSEKSGEYRYGAALPTLAAKNGMEFLGWSVTPEYTTDDSITTTALSSNTTLYALFGYTVTFDYGYDREAGRVFNSLVVSDGQTVQAKAEAFGNPFRVGYDFGGWYLDEACTQEFDVSASVTGSRTVYAKWTAKGASPDGGAGGKTNKALPWIIVGSVAGGLIVAGVVAFLILKRKRHIRG